MLSLWYSMSWCHAMPSLIRIEFLVAWFGRIGNSSDSCESAWRAMKIELQYRMIRAYRFVRIALRIARATKFELGPPPPQKCDSSCRRCLRLLVLEPHSDHVWNHGRSCKIMPLIFAWKCLILPESACKCLILFSENGRKCLKVPNKHEFVFNEIPSLVLSFTQT